MTDNPSRLLDILVYQFGKVASTSIQRTLQTIPNANTYQTHFLGREFLHSKLDQLLDPRLHPRFVEHGQGQLLHNISLTRLLNSHLEGEVVDRKLVVLTIVREPLDWFRSQFVQEIDAYLHDLIALTGSQDTGSEEEAISKGLRQIMHELKAALNACKGLANPEFRTIFHSKYSAELLEADPSRAHVILTHIRTFLRPFFWFDDLVEPVFGFGLPDVHLDSERFASIGFDWGSFLIMRFEDIHTNFPKVLKHLGAEHNELATENISKSKPYSDVIRTSFSPWHEDKDLIALTNSRYTGKFGYSTPS